MSADYERLRQLAERAPIRQLFNEWNPASVHAANPDAILLAPDELALVLALLGELVAVRERAERAEAEREAAVHNAMHDANEDRARQAEAALVAVREERDAALRALGKVAASLVDAERERDTYREALRACPDCGGDGGNNWFDRSICAEPCGMMHTRCSNCGAPLDDCAHPAPAAVVDTPQDET